MSSFRVVDSATKQSESNDFNRGRGRELVKRDLGFSVASQVSATIFWSLWYERFFSNRPGFPKVY